MEVIYTKKGVHPIGPYSQAIKAGGFVFLAGQVACDSSATPIEGTTVDKARRMCQNASAVLEAAGSSLEKVVKVTIFFEDIERDFADVNKVFGEYFTSRPGRTSVQVAKLPLGLSLEMEVTALA